jgi:hypothetical protein
MGNFSRDTFDPLKRYVSVRLQQGVPLLDADWNEMEDIRRAELRTFLKWFIGDGVPFNNNGFRIEARSAPDNDNDFMILAGGARDSFGAGRYLVNGFEVFITTDIPFTAQPLHIAQGTSAQTLADALGVDIIEMPPLLDGPVTVYLDVWEQEVDSGNDDQLINPLIGVETCVRVKREWAVRVRPATNVPQSTDSDYVANHSYAPLAIILREAGDSTINPRDISDRRRTGITLTEHLKVPISIQQGSEILNLDRFAAMLNGLRTSLFDRLRGGQLPYQTATPRNETILLMALQEIMNRAHIGELQTAARNIDNQDGLVFMEGLYQEQKQFLQVLNEIGNVGNTATEFIEDYQKYLDGSAADLIKGLKLALDNQDLLAAAIAQEELNTFLSSPTGNLPEGNVVMLYQAAIPSDENLAAGVTHIFTYTVNASFDSPQPTETFNIQATLTPGSFGNITQIEPSSLSFNTPGGEQSVQVTITTSGSAATATLDVVAVSVRNPTVLRSPQPAITLNRDQLPPIGTFFFYAGPRLNPDGQLAIPQAQFTRPQGRNVLFRLRNENASQTRTYTVSGQVIFSDISSPVNWTVSVPLSPFDVAPNSETDAPVNVRATADTSTNPPPDPGLIGNIVAAVTLTAIDGTPTSGSPQSVTVTIPFIIV